MKNYAVIFALSWLFLGGIASAQSQPMIYGRTIYHDDKSRTESVSDPSTREMVETTYNTAGVAMVKKVFLLNEKGEPLQGNVYDGRGNLVARCQSLYDDFGRRKEDRLMNLNGEVFQQVLHEYDSAGKALKPKVMNLNVSSPTIRPQSVDFTQSANTNGATNGGRFAPIPVGEGTNPTAPNSSTVPAGDKKSKPNFFKNLFKKKEKP
jgi:hypothetical protein